MNWPFPPAFNPKDPWPRLPQHSHPLTLAYLASVKASTHEQMRDASRLITSLEGVTSAIVREQCKLAAEVILEKSSVLSTNENAVHNSFD